MEYSENSRALVEKSNRTGRYGKDPTFVSEPYGHRPKRCASHAPSSAPEGVVSLPSLKWAAVGRKGVLLNGDWKDMSLRRLFLLCPSHSSSRFCFGPFRERITGTIRVPPQVLPHLVDHPKLFHVNELFLPSSLPQDVSTSLGLCPTLTASNSFLLRPSLLDLLLLPPRPAFTAFSRPLPP